MRAYVFRFAPNNGHRQTDPTGPFVPNRKSAACYSITSSGAGAFVPAAFAMWQRRRDSLTSVDKNMVKQLTESVR